MISEARIMITCEHAGRSTSVISIASWLPAFDRLGVYEDVFTRDIGFTKGLLWGCLDKGWAGPCIGLEPAQGFGIFKARPGRKAAAWYAQSIMCPLGYHTKAPAQAGPGLQALVAGLGLGFEILKPEPAKAGPKLRLSGRTGP
ncbi:hypothetical protein C8R47DRAFT_1073636 [Mycena vitilis]|nr:hypothetical protein C8R47DRAFT_1073636 [Mycena vitilis]